MRRFLSFIRLILITGVIVGILFSIVSSLSYETLALVLNRFAPDGRVESFTEIRYHFLSKILLPLGAGLVVASGITLYCWVKISGKIESWLDRVICFYGRIREDAVLFTNHVLSISEIRSEYWLIWLLALMALVVRLANLHIPMEYDEAYTYNSFASFPLWYVITDYHVPNNHVLSTIFINILAGLFGNHLWVIRLPALIAGVLMVPSSYWLGKSLYGKEAAILGSVFVIFFPLLVKFSVLARGYAFISLFTLMSFWLADYVRTNKNRFAWLMLVVVSALGFYTIPIMLLPFGALYVWLFLSLLFRDIDSYRPPSEFLKYILIGGVSTLLLTAFFYSPILLNPSNHFFRNKFVSPLGWDVYPSVILTKLSKTWADWTGNIPGWIVMLGVVGLILSLILHNKIGRQKISLQSALLIWLLGYFILRRPDMETRMWTFLAAPILIWSAGGLIGFMKVLSTHFKKEWQLGEKVSGIILVCAMFPVIFTASTIPERWMQKGSVENVVIYLKAQLQEGDLISMSEDFKPLVQYYFGIYDIPFAYMNRSGTFKRSYILVRSVNWSADSGDTLELVAPRNERNLPAIDLRTAKIVQQYQDLTLYEGYPKP